MTVTFVASGTTDAGTTSITPGYPAGMAAQDLMILTVINKHPPNIPTTPTGWILRKRQSGSDATPSLLDVVTSDEYALTDEGTSGSYDYFLVFDAGGKELEFAVPEAAYGEVMEGDTGLLIHRGNLFKRFISSTTGWDSSTGHAEIRKV